MKKRISILLLAVVVLTVTCIIVGNIISSSDIGLSNSEDVNIAERDITRFEWIEKLCQRVGVDTYKEDSPYFLDVQEDNSYFVYVQAAVEWGILEKTNNFEGDKAATEEFVALTTMKALGFYKIQMQDEIPKELTNADFIELAIENSLTKEDRLQENVSTKECKKALDKFDALYFGTYLRDDYCKLEYKENVVELPLEMVIWNNEDYSRIIIQTENQFAKGTILILEQQSSGLRFAKKIVSVEADGSYVLTDTMIEEVIEELVVSDITTVNVKNIICYYDLKEQQGVSATNMAQKYQAMALATEQLTNEGFTLELSTSQEEEQNVLCVGITDNNTGISYELPEQIPIGIEEEYSVEIEVSDIIVSAQLDYNATTGVNYADVTAQADASMKGSIELPMGVDKKIPLFKTPVPLGNGLIGIDIEFYLSLSAEGSISLEVEIPMQASVRYEREKGLGNMQCDVDVKEPKMQINCEGSCILCLEPALVILKCVEVLDVQIEEGITASAELTQYSTAQVCTDISVAFPVITISVCNNDDQETIVGLLGWSSEWEIVDSDNAKVQLDFHHEILPNGVMQFVEECTYEETDTKEPEESVTSDSIQQDVCLETEEIELTNTWFTKDSLVNSVSGFTYSFAYPDNWKLTNEIVPTIRWTGEENSGSLMEGVTLTNSRGVEIQYADVVGDFFEDSYYTVNVTKVGDSLLETLPFDDDIDSVYMPKYIVAKIEIVEKIVEEESSDKLQVKDTYYAVVPSDFLRTQEKARGSSYEGLTLMYFYYVHHNEEEPNDISDEYRGRTAFFAKAPDGQFSEQEEREVISILGSFIAGVYEEDWELYDKLAMEYYKAYEEFFKELNER